MKFSIVIPAKLYNSYLSKTLKKLINQIYKNYEVLIILDFEEEIKDTFPENFNFIYSGIKSPGEKRNIGIDRSTGDFVAFLDDDAYPSDDWLLVASNELQLNVEIGICGPSITPEESTFLEKISGHIYESFLVSGPTFYRHLPDKRRRVNDYPSVNLIISRKILEEVGGFDINYWPGEDTKLCLDILNKFGKDILYVPELKVFHFRREIFHPHLNQLSRYALHRGYFARVLPKTSLKLSYMIPSIFLIYIISLPIFLISQNLILLVPLVVYLGLVFYEMYRIYHKTGSIAHTVLFGTGIGFTHLFYGFNFLKGLVINPKIKLRDIDIVSEKYING